MNFLKSTMSAATLAFAATGAQAAPIDLLSYGYEAGSEIYSEVADVFEDGFGMLHVSDGALATFDLVNFDLSDPTGTLLSLYAFDPVTYDTLGSLADSFGATAIGDDGDSLQFLFEDMVGDGVYAIYDGADILVEVSAAGLGGYLAAPSDLGYFDFGTVTLTELLPASEVPLPASGLLVLCGMAAFARVKRVQSKRAAA